MRVCHLDLVASVLTVHSHCRSALVTGATYHIAILVADGAFSNALLKKYEAALVEVVMFAF